MSTPDTQQPARWAVMLAKRLFNPSPCWTVMSTADVREVLDKAAIIEAAAPKAQASSTGAALDRARHADARLARVIEERDQARASCEAIPGLLAPFLELEDVEAIPMPLYRQLCAQARLALLSLPEPNTARADCERLREALTIIAQNCPCDNHGMGCPCQTIAETALAVLPAPAPGTQASPAQP